MNISTSVAPPIKVTGTAEINLAEGSNNTLTSKGSSYAGIHVPTTSQVTFTGSGNLEIKNNTAVNIDSSCGIGGQQAGDTPYSCGTIIFDSSLTGTITAKGGSRAAGIGTCMRVNAGKIISGSIQIKGGIIQAVGGTYARGIGTGPDDGGGNLDILITGGEITADKIGIGVASQIQISITIIGGKITASIQGNENSVPLKQVIIGPDADLTDASLTNNITNSLIFTETEGNKTGEVKGYVTIPDGVDLVISAGDKLIVNSPNTLSGDPIIEGGTISGNNINNEDFTYKVFYDKQGGEWIEGYEPTISEYGKTDIEENTAIIDNLPSDKNITKDKYTFKGWSETEAGTIISKYTLKGSKDILYAIWEPIAIETEQNLKPITGTVGMNFTEKDLTDLVKNPTVVGTCIYSLNETLTDFTLSTDGKLTATNSLTTAMLNKTVTVTITAENGATTTVDLTFNIAKATTTIDDWTESIDAITYGTEVDITPPAVTTPEAMNVTSTNYAKKTGEDTWEEPTTDKPTDAGTYKIIVVYEGDNYTATVEKEFEIGKATITVTPNSDQLIYQDQKEIYKPTYTSSGAIEGETAGFIGDLAWGDGNKITSGDLTLTNNETFKASNYQLAVDENVNYTLKDENAADQIAILPTGVVGNDDKWYQAIELTAPSGFTFDEAGATSYQLQDGTTHKYSLWHNGIQYPHTLTINVDGTAPESIVTPSVSNTTATFTLKDAMSGIHSFKVMNGSNEVKSATYNEGDQSVTYTYTGSAGTYTFSFTIYDVAGNVSTQDVTFTLSKPYTPPPYYPSYYYYDVTLPTIEGATTSPAAGKHTVRGGYSFTFTITLDEAYSESTPVVTLDNGETVTPNSRGEYIIRSIWDDVEIFINGIELNDPTANETINSGRSKIWNGNGNLYILPAQTGKMYIVTMTGAVRQVINVNAGELQRVQLPEGIYVIVLPDVRMKVVL